MATVDAAMTAHASTAAKTAVLTEEHVMRIRSAVRVAVRQKDLNAALTETITAITVAHVAGTGNALPKAENAVPMGRFVTAVFSASSTIASRPVVQA